MGHWPRRDGAQLAAERADRAHHSGPALVEEAYGGPAARGRDELLRVSAQIAARRRLPVRPW
jgi:hypothetical protein